MTTYFPPKKNTAYVAYISLISQANTKIMQSTPTIASGDFKVSIDGGTLNNLTTLPSVAPASSKMVLISLSSSEMNGDNITIVCSDAAGAEWCDLVINLQTTARQIDDLAYPATSGRSMVVDASGLVDALAVKQGPSGSGTALTARDIGTSVLLSSGTGTGQLDFTSGVVKANLAQILGTALTETSGLIAAGFKKFFNVATPTGTINSIPDAVAGATGGLVIAGSNAAITANITGNITGNLSGSVGSVSGAVGSVTGAVGSVTGNVGGNVVGSVGSLTTNNDKTGYGLSAAAVQAMWDALTSVLTTPGSIGKWIVDKLDVVLSTRLATSGYTAPLDAAGTRTAVGLATANLDTQLSTIDDFLDTEVAAIKAKTDNLPAAPAAVSDIPTANANADALLDRAAGVETGLTLRQAARLWSAALAGKASGLATATAVYRNAVADSKARITATVDADGNRTAITTDVT